MLALAANAALSSGSTQRPSVQIGNGPIVVPSTYSGDLRWLPRRRPLERREREELREPTPQASKFAGIEPAAPTPPAATAMPAPSASFDGLQRATWGALWPPDPVGDVGPNHYVQAVNTSVGVFSKTGTLLTAFAFDSLWSGTGTACDDFNYGDPTVVYDPIGNRFIVADFAFANFDSPPYYECIAVSKSGDPVSGGWYLYPVRTDDASHPWFADYPKMGIWPDGLYMTANMFSPSGPAEVRVWAFNRSDLESGAPLRSVVVDLGTPAYFSLLPSNFRGEPPPAGRPNFLVDESQSLFAFDVWTFHVDYSGSGSSFTGPTTVSQTRYTVANSTVPSPANPLDSLPERLMMQAQYRKIAGVESLWVNHTVQTSPSGPTGIQWAQIDVTGGAVGTAPVQQQVFGNVGGDGVHRWLGSLAVDRNGDMALGYSASKATSNPSIRYSGRLAADAPGTLAQGEAVLIQGGGSQSGLCGRSACSRWGDYSAMSVDPDGCTFWYTSEYYATTGLDWHTRIGSFRFPGCSPAPVVTSFAPTSGKLKSTVVLSGSGFTGATAVTFNGVAASFSVDADSQITATVPVGASTGQIAVTTAAGSGTSTESFAVLPTLLPSPTSGTAGRPATLTGGGFRAGSAVTVKWNCTSTGCASTTVLATPTADSSGGFTTSITIPADSTAGTYSIGGRDSFGAFARTFFTVLPKLTDSPTSGFPGSTFGVTGTGYHPGSAVTLKWNCGTKLCTSTTVLATPTADPSGAFTVSLTAPADATAGSYSVGGKDSAGAFASAAFKILPRLAISPTSGAAGRAATVTGDAYKPGETVTLLWNCGSSYCTSTTVLATPIADASGHFGAAVTIPATGVTVGTTYRIRGRGGTSGGNGYASFKVTS